MTVPPTVFSRDTGLGLLLSRLGYDRDPDFWTSRDGLVTPQLRHALGVAFDHIGVVGALCLRAPLAGDRVDQAAVRHLPVVYVVGASDFAHAERLHRAIWSQSVVPQIIMALPTGFRICNGYDYRQAGPLEPWSVLTQAELPRSLSPLTSLAIRSSTAWQNFSIENRVDARIAEDIRALSAKVRAEHPTLKDRQVAVNALIGRLLYLYVLVDRNIIDQAWVESISDDSGLPLCPSIRLDEGRGTTWSAPQPWPIEEVWHLFDAIDRVLNGSVFPIEATDRALVPTEAMHLIRRVLRSDVLDKQGNQQFAFIEVDYSTIRTETISAIYECFFELEAAGERKKHGAYYTPPFLVDYVVQEADRISPLTSASRIVDPACGSGAFLVAAYRHILEQSRPGGVAHDIASLRRILTECIRGIELKQQAANVARFSLYLTLLDYLPGRTLESLHEELGDERLFPNLESNIVTRDAFAPLPAGFERQASHVLGNPPWNRASEGSLALAYAGELLGAMNDTVVDEQSMAQIFYWRAARDIAAAGAVIAFVVPTKCFIAPAAHHFPHALAERTRIHGITNLTSFRRKLFPDAEEAATVVFAASEPPTPSASGWRFSPKISSQPVGSDGVPWAIVVDRGQVERFHQSELLTENHLWYRDLLLQPLDRRLAAALETTGHAGGLLNVAGFLARSGMHVSVGETYARTGLPKEYVLGSDYRTRLGLSDRPLLAADAQQSTEYTLPNELFDNLSDRLKQMFGGPTLFIPRSQAGTDVVGRAAYNASIQGVYFVDETVPPDLRQPVLTEFGRYLRTAVGRYLISVFGRQWIADQRRFETPDLKRLPFPYLDYRELLERPISSFADPEDEERAERRFAEFAAARFGLPAIFAYAVMEHREIREPFQNGKRPANAHLPVKDDRRSIYEESIQGELRHLLADTPLELRSIALPGDRREVQIILAPDPASIPAVSEPMPPADLGSEAFMELRDNGDYAVARILKPTARTAWTAERAYADALSVAHRIMAG